MTYLERLNMLCSDPTRFAGENETEARLLGALPDPAPFAALDCWTLGPLGFVQAVCTASLVLLTPLGSPVLLSSGASHLPSSENSDMSRQRECWLGRAESLSREGWLYPEPRRLLPWMFCHKRREVFGLYPAEATFHVPLGSQTDCPCSNSSSTTPWGALRQ